MTAQARFPRGSRRQWWYHRNDARVHHVHLREVDVTGIDNHELNSLKLVDAGARS
jgi:hypothetical protein